MEKNLRVSNLYNQREYNYDSRRDLLNYYNQILCGGCYFASRLKLFEDAYEGYGNGWIIEVGNYFGASLICLAAGSKMAGREKVIAIDRMNADNDGFHLFEFGRWHSSPNMTSTLLQNLTICGVRDWAIPIIHDSDTIFDILSNIKVRLLHLDGMHHYDGIKRDLENYTKLVIPGGIIHCHDFDQEEVKQAISEYQQYFTPFEIISESAETTIAVRGVKL